MHKCLLSDIVFITLQNIDQPFYLYSHYFSVEIILCYFFFFYSIYAIHLDFILETKYFF